MHPNYEFLLTYAAAHPDGPVLDYGCGSGNVVVEGLRRGIDIEGAEVFYAGGDTRAQVEATGLMGDRIHEIRDGRLPFEDGRFGLVMSNQVFEHVEDLDEVLEEINRVLCPGGQLLSLFPSREVWREGHCGLPFLHRLPPDHALTRRYATTARRLGLGYHKDDAPPEEWAGRTIDWVDRYCFYRSKRDIERAYARFFDVEPIEEIHAAFRMRLRYGETAARIVRMPAARGPVRVAMRKLAHMTFVARKRP